MKQIILNPIFLPVILGIAIIYFILLFHFASSNKKIGNLLGDAFTLFVFCVMHNLTISPFYRFYPGLLAQKKFEIMSVSGIIVIGFYLIAFIPLNIYFQKYTEHIVSLFKDPFLGTLICLAVFSPFWSFEVANTLVSTLILAFISFLASHIARRYSLKKIHFFLKVSHAFTTFISMFYALFKPAIGLHRKGWTGIAIHPNYLGILVAFNIVLWTIDAVSKPKYSWLSWSVVIISFYIIQMANSAGSFVTCILMLAMLGLLRFLRSMSAQTAFTIILLFLVVGSVGAILLIENWVEFLSALDKDPSLTGRTEFWPQLIEAINKKPLFGYGYHNFWQPWRGIDNPATGIETKSGFIPPHAHNGFIELGLDLGYVGLLLFIISFFRTLALGSILLTKSRQLESSLPIIFLSYLVLQNVTESRLFAINFVWFYYVMFSVKLNHQ